MSLEKWKRNEIYQAIVEEELDPRDFRLEESEDEMRINHLRSPSYFLVDLKHPGHYVGTYLVGDSVVWPYPTSSAWQYLMPRISRWLSEVKRELEIPDLWAELQAEENLLGAGAEEAIENTPFTPDEQAEIAGRLYELTDQARNTYSLSDAQMRALEAKIDYLVEASARMGRIDWRTSWPVRCSPTPGTSRCRRIPLEASCYQLSRASHTSTRKASWPSLES